MLEEVGRYSNGDGETLVALEDGAVALVDFEHGKVSLYPANSDMAWYARETLCDDRDDPTVRYVAPTVRTQWLKKGLIRGFI